MPPSLDLIPGGRGGTLELVGDRFLYPEESDLCGKRHSLPIALVFD